MAAFNCFIYRMLNIPLTREGRIKEEQIILQIAVQNGYNPQQIRNLIKKLGEKHKNKDLTTTEDTTTNRQYKSIPYLPRISTKIKRIINNEIKEIYITFTSDNKVANILGNSKEKLDKMQKSGIYSIECGECETIYVGQTGRTLKTRAAEHMKNAKSPINHHMKFNKHIINPDTNTKLLHQEQKGKRMDLLEFYEIEKAILSPKTCLNSQLDRQMDYTPIFKLLSNYKSGNPNDATNQLDGETTN